MGTGTFRCHHTWVLAHLGTSTSGPGDPDGSCWQSRGGPSQGVAMGGGSPAPTGHHAVPPWGHSGRVPAGGHRLSPGAAGGAPSPVGEVRVLAGPPHGVGGHCRPCSIVPGGVRGARGLPARPRLALCRSGRLGCAGCWQHRLRQAWLGSTAERYRTGGAAGAWGQRHGVLLGLGTLPGLGDNATGHCWGLGTLPGLGDNAMGHCWGFGTLLGGHCKVRWWGMLRAELGGTARAQGGHCRGLGHWLGCCLGGALLRMGWRMLSQDMAGDRGSTHGTAGPSLHLCVCVAPPLPHPPRAKNTLRGEEEVAGGARAQGCGSSMDARTGSRASHGTPPPIPFSSASVIRGIF